MVSRRIVVALCLVAVIGTSGTSGTSDQDSSGSELPTDFPIISVTFPDVVVEDTTGSGLHAGPSRRGAIDFVSALGYAVQILQDTFPTARPRVGPLQLRSFSATGNRSQTLMYATCYFVRMRVDRYYARTGPVYAPAALARYMFEANHGTVDWTNPLDAHRSQELFASIPYDVEITVNTDHPFRLTYPECTGSQGHSATTVFLHELMHGMGFVSLVHATPGGEERALLRPPCFSAVRLFFRCAPVFVAIEAC